MKTLMIVPMALLFVLMSFTHSETSNYIGKFGVSASEPNTLFVEINADHSFHYVDYSVPQKLDIRGTWEMKHDKIVLTNAENSKVKFHNKWSLKNNGNSIVGRLGMCWYTLGRL